jgi:hypothetical protein
VKQNIPTIKSNKSSPLEHRGEFLNRINAQLPPDSVCVEIGVKDGDFSKLILDFIKPRKLYLIDPWEEGFDKNGETTHYSDHISHLPTAYSTDEEFFRIQSRFSSEESVEFKRGFSYDFIDSFPDNYFDFVYIDGCHLYDCVKADLEGYFPKLKESGLMCGHDYLNQSNFGVIKAVNEFIESYSFNWIGLGLDGDWALNKT